MKTTMCARSIADKIPFATGIHSEEILMACRLMSQNERNGFSPKEGSEDEEDSDVPDNDEILRMMFPDEDDDYWTGNYDIN